MIKEILASQFEQAIPGAKETKKIEMSNLETKGVGFRDFLPLDIIKGNSFESLRTANLEKQKSVENANSDTEGVNHQGLTEDEKAKIKEETGWSDEIIDAIGSWKEYEIYKAAGLQEAEINGKKCLIRTDIDLEQKDGKGRTNRERMQEGLAPLDKNGKPIELHHIGQHSDSPLAELTSQEHRGKGNDGIMHEKTKESEIDRNEFNTEKENHWKERGKDS